MKGLSRESQALIDAAREGDEPSAADRRRVRGALARKLAVGAAAGVVAATATHAAAGGIAAAGTSGAAAGTAAGAGIGAGAAAGSVGVVAAGGAAAGSGSIAAGALATGFGAKLLVSVAIVGAMSAGTVGYVRHEAAKRAHAQAVAVERSVAPSAPAPAAIGPAARAPLSLGKGGSPSSLPSVPVPSPAVDLPAVPAIAAAPEVTSEKPSAMTKPLAGAASPAPSGVAPSAPSGLDVELALLEEAHGALRANDGARALRLLDEHSRRFPNGALAEESEAARVFALCQVGRADEARDVAGRFLREHPRSLMAPRVTRVCDGEPSTF